MPYYDVNSIREDIWFNGFIKLNAVYSHKEKCLCTKNGHPIDNVGAYVCKYMTESNVDSRLVGNKSYFTSRNLSKSVEVNEDRLVENLVNSLPADKVVYKNFYENDYNSTSYVQYNMKRVKNKVVDDKKKLLMYEQFYYIFY